MLHIYGEKTKKDILLGGVCSLQLAHFPAKILNFFVFFRYFWVLWLMSNKSHDVNTPLACYIHYADIMPLACL